MLVFSNLTEFDLLNCDNIYIYIIISHRDQLQYEYKVKPKRYALEWSSKIA